MGLTVISGARLVGILVTVAGLLWIVGLEISNARWKKQFRELMQDKHVRHVQLNLWLWYVGRLQHHHKVLNKRFVLTRHLLALVILCLAVFSATMVLKYNPLFAVTLSVLGSMAGYERWWAKRARNMRDQIVEAWMNQGVAVGVHVLTATQRLDDALRRMAKMVKHAGLKTRLESLVDLLRAPQFATPEDAFLHMTHQWGIVELEYFALATKQAKRYNMPLADLWLQMSDLLGRDIEYRRAMRAHTDHHRKGGYVFYGMLAGTFLLMYPFLEKYMSSGTKTLFWVTIAVMTCGLALVVRVSESIDV